MPTVVRSLTCSVAQPVPPPVLSLLLDFRLMVNRSVRFALENRLTARGSLTTFARKLACEIHVNILHARSATEIALSLDKGHRRRLRRGSRSSVPYARTPFLVADDETFHLDPATGHLRLSLRNGEWAGVDLVLSDWHRSVLAHVRIKQLRLNAHYAVLVVDREVPEPYEPKALLALDTNERSLDGVLVRNRRRPTPVVVPIPEVATIQHRHFVRRRRIARKKAHDRRVGGRLLGKEGKRERHRIVQRLHLLSLMLIAQAKKRHAALVLEDLHMPQGGGRGRKMRRRLSSWPQGELHRQLEYKAADSGVPVIKVNPRYTSKTCPKCGVRKDRRCRVGPVFVCDACGWRCDRQLNAGLNIGRTVLREAATRPSNAGLGGLRLDPDALSEDTMTLLYKPGNAGAHGRSGGEGVLRAQAREGTEFRYEARAGTDPHD